MQPNQNMPGVGQPMGPTRPVAPAGPAKPVDSINPVSPVKSAEPVGGPTFDNGPSVVEGKGGKKTGWILGIVLCLILAAGGIGFGVWAWMDGNTQKDALNSQISTLKQQNNSLQEQLGDVDTINGNADTADYIYVGEWGQKIKIPENLHIVSYDYNIGYMGYDNHGSLCVNGVSDEDKQEIVYNFAKGESAYGMRQCMAVVYMGDGNTPVEERTYLSDPELAAFSINGLYYWVYGSQSLYSSSEDEMKVESDSRDMILEMLSNPENYSKI